MIWKLLQTYPCWEQIKLSINFGSVLSFNWDWLLRQRRKCLPHLMHILAENFEATPNSKAFYCPSGFRLRVWTNSESHKNSSGQLGYVYTSSFPWKKPTYPYLLGTPFSEELLQRRDVVYLSFWKLYIPYRIGAFSRRYGKLSGIVETLFIVRWFTLKFTRLAVLAVFKPPR
jgi:hypothetical protein